MELSKELIKYCYTHRSKKTGNIDCVGCQMLNECNNPPLISSMEDLDKWTEKQNTKFEGLNLQEYSIKHIKTQDLIFTVKTETLEGLNQEIKRRGYKLKEVIISEN